MLLALLIEFGACTGAALAAYFAVRWFGWIAWLNNGIKLAAESDEK